MYMRAEVIYGTRPVREGSSTAYVVGKILYGGYRLLYYGQSRCRLSGTKDMYLGGISDLDVRLIMTSPPTDSGCLGF
jgi:hypothetical protein